MTTTEYYPTERSIDKPLDSQYVSRVFSDTESDLSIWLKMISKRIEVHFPNVGDIYISQVLEEVDEFMCVEDDELILKVKKEVDEIWSQV